MNPAGSTTKPAWRRDLAARRLGLDPLERARASARASERLLALPEFERARRLLVCLSFGTELDTGPLIERLLEEGRELYVPRAARADGRLHLHRFPCPLVTLGFGLRQPPAGTAEIACEEIDTVLDAALVLGLGFDRRGYRLGYGSGYFDRFLAGRPFPAIGLAFDAQLVAELPAEAHDVPMGLVVTERRVIRPAAAARVAPEEPPARQADAD